MDYEKKYEEALERAKAGKPMDEVFPELKESEDEMIRKMLISLVKHHSDVLEQAHEKEMIAYLEKQKEQKDWAEELNTKIKELHKQCLAQLKPAEWSEEDSDMICEIIDHCITIPYIGGTLHLSDERKKELKTFVKSLRPQPKQEGEPMEIKFAGKIYKVYGTKELPGGGVGYIIEDEPGHYDCIIHPEEVLGGGYGIKSHGSPYPTK